MTAKPRARRIAADECHSWARNLRLGNPYAKLVLSMLTLYVQADGACFVGIEALAEDTELSPDTVRKRLAWLETVGAIARFPQWLDASGRRNGDGNGKRTTDEIRLLLSADSDEIERRAAGDLSESTEPAERANPAPETSVSPRSQQGLTDAVANRSPRLAPGQHSDSGKGLISEPEPEDSPRSPPLGGDDGSELSDGEASEAPSWPHLESWKCFESAWQEPILRQRLCRQLWSAFTDAEREQAILVAQGYVSWRNAQRKPPNPVNAERMLRERDAWPGYAARAPKPRTVEVPAPRTRIATDSPEFLAIKLCYAIAGLPHPTPFGSPPAIEVAIDVPHGAAAMGDLIRLPPERTEWVIHKKDSREYIAWCQRVHEWTGRWPDPKRFWLDERGDVVASAAEAYKPPGALVPRAIDGLRVPKTATGFPPAKGGDPPAEAESAA